MKIGWFIFIGIIVLLLFVFASWIYIDSTSGPLRWDSTTKSVEVLEGITSIRTNCFGQNPHLVVGDTLLYKIGILNLWDTNDEIILAPHEILKGKQVTIYEKKFWWFSRYFLVCE